MEKKTEAYSFQVDTELIKLAKLKINLPEAMRALVSKIVKTDVCPTCGHHLKRKK